MCQITSVPHLKLQVIISVVEDILNNKLSINKTLKPIQKDQGNESKMGGYKWGSQHIKERI